MQKKGIENSEKKYIRCFRDKFPLLFNFIKASVVHYMVGHVTWAFMRKTFDTKIS